MKTLIAAVLVGFIFLCSADIARAYDLPKIKADRKVTAETDKRGGFKSDWSHVNRFEAKIRAALAEGELPASSPVRIAEDRNHIFIGFYNDSAYFLDKYSISVRKDTAARRIWTQRIFPIGSGISSKNSKATAQKFSVDGVDIYNSGRKIDAVKDEADRDFLNECFKVGYYYAFGEDFDKR